MAKQIHLSYEGKDYTLEFNRRIAKRMQENGFSIDTDKPLMLVDELFAGAFIMHHRKIDPDLAQKIWYAQKGRKKLLTALVEMYTDTYKTLIEDDGEEDDDENPTWTQG